MKQFFIYLLLFICSTTSFIAKAQSGSGWEWATTTGAANANNGIKAVTTDASGNVYATGLYKDNMTFGSITLGGTPAGGLHGFIAKYDNLGNVLWATALNNGNPGTIAVDADGNSYVGGIDNSIPTSNIGYSFVAKFDNNGNKLWTRIFTLNETIALNVGPDGNPIAIDMFLGYRNIYKLNKTDGSIIWTVANTGTNIASDNTSSYGNFLDSKGNVYYTLIGFTYGTNTQVVAGVSFINPGNTTCLVSLDNNGNRRWIDSASNGVLGLPTAGICEVGKNDKIYYSLGISAATSGISGTNQALTAQAGYFELDDLGKVVVSKFLSPFAGNLKFSVIKNDGIYVFTSVPGGYAGYVVNYGDYSYASPATKAAGVNVIIKYDPVTYKVLWANSFETFGTTSNIGGIVRMDVTPAGKIVVAGSYNENLKFGTILKTAGTGTVGDLFIAQFDGAKVALPPSTTWTGAANNMNFNDTANWNNGVPNGINTIIPGGLSNYPNNITVAAKIGKLEIGVGATINLPLAISIPRNIVNNGSIELTDSGFFYGGFNTGQTLISGSGKVVIKKNTVNYFGYVDLDNSLEINCAGVVSGLGGIINGSLILTNGIFSGGITLSNPNATVTGNVNSYVNGNGTLKRRINASGTYNFPVGNSTIYAPVTITLTNITGPQYISVNLPEDYAQVIGTTPSINLGSQLITTKLNKNQWNVVADADVTGGSYAISLEARGYTNGVTDASSYIVIKRQADDKPWSFNGTNGVSTQVSNVASASASGITSFSTFAICIASASVAAGTTPTTSNWTGNANTVWNNAANWDNGIPNSLINAVIGTGKTNYPLVYTSIDNARSLQVNAGTNIKLPYLFTVNSEIINNGTIEVTGAYSANFNSFGNSTFGYSKLSGNGKLLFTTASPGNILGGYDNSIEINFLLRLKIRVLHVLK